MASNSAAVEPNSPEATAAHNALRAWFNTQPKTAKAVPLIPRATAPLPRATSSQQRATSPQLGPASLHPKATHPSPPSVTASTVCSAVQCDELVVPAWLLRMRTTQDAGRGAHGTGSNGQGRAARVNQAGLMVVPWSPVIAAYAALKVRHFPLNS